MATGSGATACCRCSIDPPAPFTTLPLDYAHSFGGPGCDANPAGRGYDSNRLAALVGANQGVMPNVKIADTPVNCHTRIFQPAWPRAHAHRLAAAQAPCRHL